MTVDATPYGELVARLDLPAKVRLLTGASMFTLAGEPRIGLEPMAFSDGPTGVRGLTFTGGDAVALFPNATLLASAWDEDAAQEVGDIVADEALRQHIHVVLGPTVNLHRTPAGRASLRGLLRGPAADRADRGGVRARACRPAASGPARSTSWPTSRRPSATPSTTGSASGCCASSTCCPSSSPTRRTRGRSWRRTTSSTGCPPPSSTTSSRRSSRASGAGTGCS